MAFFPDITSISDIKLLELLKEIITVKSTVKSLHRDPCLPEVIPSLTVSGSSTVHGDYQYASSQYLRHVNSIGQLLESSSAIPCTCLSEFASVPDVSKITSDDHASHVIRVIHCIAAHRHTEADQSVREQTLDFDSAG